MEKLTYEKYKGSNDILTIDLHNGYIILAIKMWDKTKQRYNVELRIKEKSVEKWDLIEEAESLEFDTNYKYINSAILKQIYNFLNNGFFDYYINRYEYELKCFDMGCEIYDKIKSQNIS